MRTRPDILVLGGGGVLGEAWLTGVLAGIEEAAGIDFRRCEYFVGTSAGSIVAARLAAGQSPRRPEITGATLERAADPVAPSLAGAALGVAQRAGAWALALSSPLMPVSLSLSARGGALARAAMLRALGRPSGSLEALRREVDATGVSFDGRLRVVAVNRSTGRRVVFGRPASPSATVGEAVEASCTVPWLFAPVRIGGTDYVDGGVWSPTNLDAAPAGRGSYVLCLNPTGGLSGSHPLLTLARGASRTLMSIEAGALRSRGASVRVVMPDAACAAAMGADLMSRGPVAEVLAAGYAQGRALAATGDERDRRLPQGVSSSVRASSFPGRGSRSSAGSRLRPQ
jgi:NTE family protein